MAGDTGAAIDLVPEAALDELTVDPDDMDRVVARARKLGVTEIAVPGFTVESTGIQLAWAATVEAELT